MLIKLALLHAWRSIRHIEFKLLGFALFIALFSQTVLMCLTSGLERTFTQEAQTLVGGDLIIEAPQEISSDLKSHIARFPLEVSNQIEFLTMVSFHDQFQLTNIHAIEANFPLYGQQIIETDQGVIKRGAPQAGEIWIDETLQAKQNLKIGDRVDLGEKKFKVAGILVSFPIGVPQALNLAPNAFINLADLPATQLLQPGFRASYYLFIKGPADAVALIMNKARDYPEYNWITPKSGIRTFNRIMDNTDRFSALIILIEIMLAAVVIGICTYQYTLRQSKTIAIWIVLGEKRNFIIQLHSLTLFFYTLLIASFSISLAYGTALAVLYYQNLPPIFFGLKPAILGLVAGIVLVMGFAVPALKQMQGKASAVLRFEMRQAQEPVLHLYILGILILFILFHLLYRNWLFSMQISAYLIVALNVIYIITDVLISSFKFVFNKGPLWWRFGITSFVRFKSLSIVQVVVFTVVVMLMTLIQIVQSDFLASFIAQLPAKTPNYFLINVSKNNVEHLSQWLTNQGISDFTFYPMVRGRLSHVNDMPIEAFDKEKGVSRSLNRPLNLTWAHTLPSYNEFVAGQSWQEVNPGENVISIEQRFLERQKLKLGDTLRFQIAGQDYAGRIVQVRRLHWDSFRPNFFIIFPESTLDRFPHTYITSFYLSQQQRNLIAELTRQFPDTTIIDIDAMLDEAREIIDKLAWATQTLVVILFILGILIMYASIISSLKERMRENVLLRMFGAQGNLIRKIWLVEFGIMGLIPGVLGAIFAQALAYVLARYYFDFTVTFQYRWLFISVLLSYLIVTLLGFSIVRKMFKKSVIYLMQNS